jgi:hypothetical protein
MFDLVDLCEQEWKRKSEGYSDISDPRLVKSLFWLWNFRRQRSPESSDDWLAFEGLQTLFLRDRCEQLLIQKVRKEPLFDAGCK